MIIKKLILSMMAAVLLANTPAAKAVENSNSYYAYSTASVMEMSMKSQPSAFAVIVSCAVPTPSSPCG